MAVGGGAEDLCEAVRGCDSAKIQKVNSGQAAITLPRLDTAGLLRCRVIEPQDVVHSN